MDFRHEDIVEKQNFKCFKQSKANNSDILTNAHWHEYIELLYFEDGSADVYLNGKLYKAEQGDLVIINSREVHHIVSNNPKTSYIVIQFDPDMLHMSATFFTLKYIIPFSGPDKTYPRLFKSKDLGLTQIQQRICDIYNETVNENYAYELAVQGNIIMLFLEIVRSWHGLGIDIKNDTINKRDIEWLHKAILFIEENYNQNISAKQVAEICAMSYNYFTARFKKVLGRSFSSHLNYVRLRQAEYQLVSTNDSITNVAYDSGFSSTSYFISIFSKHKGITPQNYRKRLRTTQ
jgi:AraC-like DNA-binding protein